MLDVGLLVLRAARSSPSKVRSRNRSRSNSATDKCLNEHWFISPADAKAAIEAWRVDYNTVRPHSSLDGRTPDQFAALSGGPRGPRPARTDDALKDIVSITRLD